MFGNLVLLKRWHWLVVSVLVGLAAGYAARPTSLDVRAFGEGMNGQKDFEQALVCDREGNRFVDIVVHRQSITNPDGGTRVAWVVSGLSSGNASVDGNWHWRPKFFIADEPYKPANSLTELTRGRAGGRIARFQQMARPTVLDFLDVLHDASGVSYVHAWWRSYAISTWLVASLLLIGLTLPTAIDLIVYGRFIRPREPKGLKLTASPSIPIGNKPKVTAEDLAQLEQLDADLEERLKADAAPAKPAVTVTAAPAIRKLSEVAQTASAVPVKEDHRIFGAKQDDYYPTDRKTKEGRPKAH
jgi:hypothetical protein